MRIAAFSLAGSERVRVGAVKGESGLVDLAAAAGRDAAGDFADMLTFLRGGAEAVAHALALTASGKASHALAEVRLRAPLVHPGKILAAGRNYESHRADAGAASPRPPYAEGFVKLSSSIIGPDDPIVAWPEVEQLDYEGELAVVIGRTAHHVSEADALEYVAGYTVANDVSARDWQTSERSRHRSPLLGKGFPTFCPLGPWVTLRDEIPDPQRLRLTTRVNGEIRQSGSTGEMIFTVREMVAHWSRLRLDPGDLILTGTPAGAATGRKPDPGPFWLKSGDLVEVEIEKVGVLRNAVVSAPHDA